ncbi:MAG: DUF167 domain-containing protein [Holosporales bacterium]|jgi:uncharacterized protein (TIGR00251 family)|nr:DUF167 domain-containing protein [Holosporales bacterium]
MKSILEQIIKVRNDGIEFTVYLTPGSKREEIAGLLQDGFKISVHARPNDNQANDALIEFIALVFRVAKSRVIIKRGHKSRNKILFIKDLKLADIHDTTSKYIPQINMIQKKLL